MSEGKKAVIVIGMLSIVVFSAAVIAGVTLACAGVIRWVPLPLTIMLLSWWLGKACADSLKDHKE